MRRAKARSALRSFLRGLVRTCLLLLLPCQLTLLWLARNDRPVRLPDRLIAKVSAALAAKGVRFEARALMVNPDRSLRAEDVTLGFDGAGDGVITAGRIDLRLGLSGLLAGRVEPTGIAVTDARVFLPAPLTADGRPKTLVERADVEATREGRFAVLRFLRLRSRETSVFASGEAPLAALLPGGPARPGEAPLNAAGILRELDSWMSALADGGVGSVEARVRSDGEDAAAVNVTALAASARPTRTSGLRAEDLRVSLTANLGRGRSGWTAEASARALGIMLGPQELVFSDAAVYLSPAGSGGGLKAVAKARQVTGAGWPEARLRLEATTDAQFERAETRFRLNTSGSHLEGSASVEGKAWRSARITSAHLSAEEVMGLEPAARALARAGASLSGSVILRDVRLSVAEDGGLSKASGHADLSGLGILGLSSQSIAPGRSLPLSAGFDYDPARGAKPLRLFDLRLASVTGEAEASLRAGGPFSLHLRGDLAPGCLDQVLGRWWTDLWSLFRVRSHPHAYIDVDGEWMKLGARTTGRVKLEDFAFMGAPFRGVEVTVDADARRTIIGLEDLAGGSLPEHGSVDGKVTWDWSLPPEAAGPLVDVSGDMEPWIAARCAGESFGEALKGLRLPAGRKLRVTVRPEGGKPAVTAEIAAPGQSSAWGFPLTNLRARTEGAGDRMTIRTTFGVAGGEARLDVQGDVLRKPSLDLSIRGSQPELLLAALEGSDAKQTGKGRLDLDFKGTVDLKAPRQLRGLGDYRLRDPELKKVRLLGGLSGLLEELGVNATSYELEEAKGTFGCLEGKAYLPDLTISGPQSMLTLSGESDLEGGKLNFIGDFTLLDKGGIPLIGLINPNRALIGLTKIRVKGTFSKPETTALPRLSDLIKFNKDNDLGKIPEVLKE